MATKTTSTGTSGQGNGHKKDNLLEKFFLDQLKDIYYAEQQLLKALNDMKAACTTDELVDLDFCIAESTYYFFLFKKRNQQFF